MRRSFVLYRYHLLSFWNWRASYLSRFVDPLVYFVFLTLGLSRVFTSSAAEAAIFGISGMIAFVAFRTSTATIGDVSNDRKWGIYAIYSLRGGSPFGYFVSISLFGLTLASLQILLIALIGAASSVSIVFDSLLLRSLASGVLLTLGWIGVGISIATGVNSYAKRDMVITLTSLPVLLSAPIFYPLEQSPDFVQMIASFNPLTYQLFWLRSDDFTGLIYSFLWAVFAGTLSVLLLTKSDRFSSER